MKLLGEPESRVSDHTHRGRVSCVFPSAVKTMDKCLINTAMVHLGAPNCPFYLPPGSGNTSCIGKEEK